MCPGLDSGVGLRGTGQGHTHRTGLVSKEVDDVEAVFIQAVKAVALIPALGEDIEADHASCGKQGYVRQSWEGQVRLTGLTWEKHSLFLRQDFLYLVWLWTSSVAKDSPEFLFFLPLSTCQLWDYRHRVPCPSLRRSVRYTIPRATEG